MRAFRSLVSRLVATVTRGRDEFSAELESHLQFHIDDNLRTGMSPQAARRDAHIKVGGLAVATEQLRDRRGLPFLETMLQDIRYGCRMPLQAPGFTVAAVAVLSVGLAANILIFGMANAALFKPLPIHDPGRVVRLYFEPRAELKAARVAMDRSRRYVDYVEYRDRTQTLSAVAAFQMIGVADSGTLGVRVGNEAFPVVGGVVSGNYFDTLGLEASVGRVLRPTDDVAGAPGVAVISDAMWRRRFAADPGVVGLGISLNGRPFTVVGVAPRTFVGTMFLPLAQDLWVPWNAPGFVPPPEEIARHQGRPASLIARLRPGVTLAQAQAELSTLEARLAAEHPAEFHGRAAFVFPAGTFGPEVAPALTAFMVLILGLVGLLLIIACVNIASLLLARSTGRQQEMSVRLALGASRARLVRQLLVESWLLSVLACAAAIGLGLAAIRILPSAAFVSATSPFASMSLDVAFDWRVVAFALLLTLVTTMACGLAPALQSSKHAAVDGLRSRAATTGRERSRLRGALMTGQVAIATLLLVVAGLASRSLRNAYGLDLGFQPEHLYSTALDLGARGYDGARGLSLCDQLLRRIERIPGVTATNLANILPMALTSRSVAVIRDGDAPPDPRHPPAPVFVNAVSRGHFTTMGIARLAGRDFGDGDTAAAPAVAIVNETMARRLFPGESPIGKRLRLLQAGPSASVVEIVGLVRDSTYADLSEGPTAFAYTPLTQTYHPQVNVLVRIPSGRTEVLQAVRGEIQSLDPDLALSPLLPFDASSSLLLNRAIAVLSGAAGVVALGLAGVGLFGVIAYLVRQRTREIGIRLALGATARGVVWLVVRQGARWTVGGVAIGLVAATLIAPLAVTALYGLSPRDPLVFAAVPALLISIALLACVVPGWRATRIDPMVALRQE